MKCLRLVLAVGLAATFTLAEVRAEPNVDTVAGIWRVVKCSGRDMPADASMLLQLTRDGKIVASVFEQGKRDARSGVWKLDGAKLTIQMQGEPAETETIKTLDDGKMVTVDSQGQESVLRKSK